MSTQSNDVHRLTKTIATYVHHPEAGTTFTEVRDLEAQGWAVVQILPLTYALNKGPVQDQILIFRLEINASNLADFTKGA